MGHMPSVTNPASEHVVATSSRPTVGAIGAPAPREPRAARADAPRGMAATLWAMAGLLAAGYATLSVRRHALMLTTGYDLGIFEQSVRSYAHGQLPTSLLKGIDYPLLGDHFSPILAVLAPIYAVFPVPQTLLVAQAVLLAVGLVPLSMWAARMFGPGVAVAVALIYGLGGGLAHAVAFDFHEIAFAVPLLAFSLSALGQRRYVHAVLWAAPLVLVKEDLGLTTAVIGGIIVLRSGRNVGRNHVTGLATIIFGVSATVWETSTVIPAFNPAGANAYTGQITPAIAIEQLATLFTTDTKIATVVLLLLPTAFIALRSPLLLAAVPTLLWRFLSDNPNYWGTSFHYDAVLVPIVTAAFVEGLSRVRSDPFRGDRRIRTVLAAGLVATALLFCQSPLLQLISPAFWRTPAHVVAARAVLSEIPPGASVAASNSLAPQLTGSMDVSLLGILPLDVSRPDYIVADTSIPSQWPVSGEQLANLIADAQGSYCLVETTDGVALLEREPCELGPSGRRGQTESIGRPAP